MWQKAISIRQIEIITAAAPLYTVLASDHLRSAPDDISALCVISASYFFFFEGSIMTSSSIDCYCCCCRSVANLLTKFTIRRSNTECMFNAVVVVTAESILGVIADSQAGSQQKHRSDCHPRSDRGRQVAAVKVAAKK